MKTRHLAAWLVAVCLIAPLSGCSDSPDAPRSIVKTGFVYAFVIDEGINQPVADVTITLTPGNHVATTDKRGLAIFEVPAGDYFVDADVCCIGPGFIEYHVPVEVVGGETARVTLEACLACV
jgi:hypothetical protein